MKVYSRGSNPTSTLYICPAADTTGEVPAEWVDDNNSPLQFTIEFRHGAAEVPDPIGKYLIARGYAKKTKLILPTLVA
ncbi:hypothetical protein [Bradyrhizobium sp. Tv2a-2]|uniref:hypothetical protein n=1 Tax=Bradyrhizobium sp. Tv2a-2 TaxID=113395 RepID=UPI000464C4C1|nr:hypothetical protein [Bradyrhizobium sp. Tv2a-2]